jgi:hypothetical protein
MRDKPDPALIRKLLIKVAKGRVEADPHPAYEVWRSARKEPKVYTSV